MSLVFKLGQYMTTRSRGPNYLMEVTATIQTIDWWKLESTTLQRHKGLYTWMVRVEGSPFEDDNSVCFSEYGFFTEQETVKDLMIEYDIIRFTNDNQAIRYPVCKSQWEEKPLNKCTDCRYYSPGSTELKCAVNPKALNQKYCSDRQVEKPQNISRVIMLHTSRTQPQ